MEFGEGWGHQQIPLRPDPASSHVPEVGGHLLHELNKALLSVPRPKSMTVTSFLSQSAQSKDHV